MSLLLSPVSPELTETDFAVFAHYAKHLGRAPKAKHYAFNTGDKYSHLKGQGLEMLELRAYQPSDDLRHIDWRVTARTGKAHTRLYAQEHEHQRLLMLDLSADAYFGTRHTFIATRFIQLAAIIAWRSQQQGDVLTYRLCFAGEDHQQQKLSNLSMLFQLLSRASQIINRSQAQASLQIAKPDAITKKMRNKDIILLTDKQSLSPQELAHLHYLAEHNKVFWVQIIDDNAFNLAAGQYHIKHAKGSDLVNVSHTSAELARASFIKHNQQLKHKLNHLGIEHLLFDLGEPPEGIARSLLSMGALG
ncbi:DUF58 domain-containing protein [Marinomonas sp. THO17]|uniref:DUF58 domain-containing protein n=1 Tax=Marinomonas sp. THO17 TaxID=3149048 RepID=UPI00336BB1E4